MLLRGLLLGLLVLGLACTAAPEEDGTDTVAQDLATGDAADYPPGPYGGAVDATLANLRFFDPATQAQVSLGELRGGEARILLLTSSAGWCGACLQEALEMNAIQSDYGPRGVYILYTLFQDWNGGAADQDFWDDWLSQTDPDYRVVLDEDFSLGTYFNPDSAPLNMLVDLETMKILRLETGFNREALEAFLDSLLPAQNQ